VKRAQEALPPRLRFSYDKRNLQRGSWKRTAMGEKRAALEASGDPSCCCKFRLGGFAKFVHSSCGREAHGAKILQQTDLPLQILDGLLAWILSTANMGDKCAALEALSDVPPHTV